MIRKVKEWRAKGIPIDGIGSQAHLREGMGAAAMGALQALCAAAPECAITELDIRTAPPKDYASAVKACVSIKNCVGVTAWGVRDSDSWRKQETPLLFDSNYKPKPAYDAVKQALA
jgi:endo-1,4-beta-xylanase